MPGALGVGDDQRRAGIGEHVLQGLLVLRRGHRQVDDDGDVRIRQRHGGGIGPAGSQNPDDIETEARTVGLPVDAARAGSDVVRQPLSQPPGGQVAAEYGDLEPLEAGGRAVPAGERGGMVGAVVGLAESQDPLSALVKGTELQGVHDPGELVPVGAAHGQVGSRGHAQVEVRQQVVETAVAHDVGQVVAQGLARFPLDLVGVGDDALEPVVKGDPLRRGLGADSGHARQVVAGLAHQGGQVGVALRRHAVALLDLGRRHAAQGGHALDGVEHGAAIGDRLEGVPVSGAQEDLHALSLGGGGQRSQDVIGLETGGGQGAHVHRGQHLLDELDLTDKGGRGLVARGLVSGVLLGAEGPAGQIEGDRDVGRLLALQQGQEHGDEAVDGIGGLSGGGREAVHRQSVEGSEGHGVAVNEEKASSGGGGCGAGRGSAHHASLRV